jgi:hypothetical protein
LQGDGKSLREISAVWATEFGLPKIDAKSVKRILAPDLIASPGERASHGRCPHSGTSQAQDQRGKDHRL